MLAATFGLIGTLIGGLIGARASVMITKQQLANTYHQLSLASLRERIPTMQNALLQISQVQAILPTGKLSDEQMIAPQIGMFQQRASIFLAYTYYFTREEEERILDKTRKVNVVIYRIKAGRSSTNEERVECVREIEITDSHITNLIKESLRNDEYPFAQLIDAKARW